MSLQFRGCWLAFLLAGICCISGRYCFADDRPPTTKELKQAHQQLQKYSKSVQGKFWIYRADKLHPDVFEKHPSELGIPLINEGYLWRSENRFRADFKTFRIVSGKVVERDYSVARDSKRVYEYCGTAPKVITTLQICDLNTEQAKLPLSFIDNTFVHNLDSLWSSSGVSFTEMFQQPGSKIVLDSSRTDGSRLTLLIPTKDDHPAEVVLKTNTPYPFKSTLIIPNKRMRLERRVDSVTVDGLVLPSRIIDLADVGGDEYTEVILFELEPLADHSPIETDFDSDSFKNMRSDYIVDYVKEPEGWLREQYNLIRGNLTLIAKSPGSYKTLFLWIGIVAVGLILVWFIFSRKRKQ